MKTSQKTLCYQCSGPVQVPLFLALWELIIFLYTKMGFIINPEQPAATGFSVCGLFLSKIIQF